MKKSGQVQIFVKLYGELKDYAPGDRPHFALHLEPGTCVEEVLRLLAVPGDRHVALINGRRSTAGETFTEGDTLVLLPLISGG